MLFFPLAWVYLLLQGGSFSWETKVALLITDSHTLQLLQYLHPDDTWCWSSNKATVQLSTAQQHSTTQAQRQLHPIFSIIAWNSWIYLFSLPFIQDKVSCSLGICLVLTETSQSILFSSLLFLLLWIFLCWFSRMQRIREGIHIRTMKAKRKVEEISKEDLLAFLRKNAFVLFTVGAVIVGEYAGCGPIIHPLTVNQQNCHLFLCPQVSF